MDVWTALLDVLIILAAALLLGGVLERLKQNAILGYLLAGALLGPHAFNLIPNHEAIAAITELGVALLLFVIGLEFSWKRLRSLGVIALGGGALQVVLTLAVAAGVSMAVGLDTDTALTVGAIVALSSTAVVMRLLSDRTEIDSVHGRNTLGILLTQDIAVVPLVLMVSVLGGDGAAAGVVREVARVLGGAAVLALGLYVALNHIVPRLLWTREATRNRDLPVLLTIVTAVGSAWSAHALGVSPVLGAFVAGVLLAASPFAAQVRADIAPLKTLFVTLFFSSIGVLVNPGWIVGHWPVVLATLAAVVVGKALMASVSVRVFGTSNGYSLATGLCLAQVGEFSFLIADVGRSGGVIGGSLFELMITVAVVSLMVTPYLVAFANRAARFIDGRRGDDDASRALDDAHGAAPVCDHVVVIGFGPAGREVVERLLEQDHALAVVELNPRLASQAEALGVPFVVGDATRWEVLHEVHVAAAKAVAVTLPDPTVALQIVTQVRSAGCRASVVARARYHRYADDLRRAGASVVVDEETEVGTRVAAAVAAVKSVDPS